MARAQHALGLCALSDGDYQTAFRLLSALFRDDGTPLHDHASYLAVADLALAAARSGHRLEGRETLKRIAVSDRRPDPGSSPRLSQLSARANGLLADPAIAVAYWAAALDHQTGAQWPFERAQLHLEFGEWLRRGRRINEARPVLGAALEAFLALGARPWQERARTELRASGVAVPGALADPGRLREVTPQQLEILRLAAQGLSNREIAQRLFLSPRTVASHLYRSFPKLGVAGRNQLHLLFPQPEIPG
jgi:DNA-binding CsgD family transcriptional regulator